MFSVCVCIVCVLSLLCSVCVGCWMLCCVCFVCGFFYKQCVLCMCVFFYKQCVCRVLYLSVLCTCAMCVLCVSAEIRVNVCVNVVCRIYINVGIMNT